MLVLQNDKTGEKLKLKKPFTNKRISIGKDEKYSEVVQNRFIFRICSELLYVREVQLRLYGACVQHCSNDRMGT